ncbi:MAG: hypothetical protein WBQ94_18205 [Terracidiphilus sp.]
MTREELYSLVWAKPMTEVGQDFHISDRAMAKLCAKRQVPAPPRGYWAKKNAGITVQKPPLPEFVAKPHKEMSARVTPAKQAPEKRKALSAYEERNQTIKKALKEFRKSLSEAVDYTLSIDKWNCDYSFGLNSSYDPLHRDDVVSFLHQSPFSEYRDLVLRGVFLAPAKLRDRKCEVRFVRRAHLDKRPSKKTCIAIRNRHQNALEGFQSKTVAFWVYWLGLKTRSDLLIRMQPLTRSNSSLYEAKNSATGVVTSIVIPSRKSKKSDAVLPGPTSSSRLCRSAVPRGLLRRRIDRDRVRKLDTQPRYSCRSWTGRGRRKGLGPSRPQERSRRRLGRCFCAILEPYAPGSFPVSAFAAQSSNWLFINTL